MQEAVSRSLYSYWNALRGSRPAPKRFEIEPSRIANNLPDAFILERIDAGNVRFRLAGTRIAEVLGLELRGRNLFELFDAEDRRTLQDQMDIVAARCAVGVFQIAASSDDGMTAAFEILILPLTHTRDSVERFLGSVAPVDKPGWLGSLPLTKRKLIHHEIIWPDGSPAFAEHSTQAQVPVLHRQREARIVRSARRQFRVYDGGLNQFGDDR
ncbi:MAG: PAS domain-containing protein [Hyphomicrobium sp.]|uniref:PAS domain-containing protein n=1 Tax=Hyphomicrobium sp. TaxID=82 RepID=UPI0039E65ECE